MAQTRIYMAEERRAGDGPSKNRTLIWVGKPGEVQSALHGIGSALSYVGYRVEHPDGISQGSNVKGIIHLILG